MKTHCRELGILGALIFTAASACVGPPQMSSQDAGTVRAAVQLAPGTTLDTVSYAIGGPGGFARAGNVDVSHSATVSFTVGGIPAGQGYNISISGTASNGTTTCSGSGTFAITPRMTTVLSIKIQCREQPRTGSVQINGTLNICPVVDGISASPGEVMVGFPAALAATAHDTDSRPGPISYSWVATSGMLAGATTPNPTLFCTAVGVSAVILTVSDGDCTDTGSVTIVCSPVPAAPALVRINEVESNMGVPGDWVELTNVGGATADIGGYVIRDNNDANGYVIPAGTTLAPGAYFVLEEAAFNFGLGGADSARLFDPAGALVDSYTWAAHAATTYGRCPDGTGDFVNQIASSKGAANNCGGGMGGAGGGMGGAGGGAAGAGGAAGGSGMGGGAPAPIVRINEIESSQGTPGDWVELYNAGSSTVDLGGWGFKDNDDTHNYLIPAGTTLAPGAYYLLEEAAFGFGLGAMESARLYDAAGALVDQHDWTAHAATTYGRCPNGSGAFVNQATVSKGAANDCGGGAAGMGGGAAGIGGGAAGMGGGAAGTGGSVATLPWPGDDAVVTVDEMNQFPSNLSGITYQPATAGSPAVLWAVLNSPSTLFRLVWNGTTFVNTSTDGWAAGKLLHYATGTGGPDSEGVTLAELDSPAIYVASERDNNASSVSRLSVLRFDLTAAGSELTATHDWNLTADLPVVGANLGLEAITWIPDSYLVAAGFGDQNLFKAYDPADYPGHGTGLFFVGVEATGLIHGYALDHAAGGFQRITTVSTGNAGVMGIDFDREAGNLWAYCDNTCGNRASVLQVGAGGGFQIQRFYARPAGLPDSNNEGIAIAPESECTAGRKSFFWSDDSNFGAHALRQGNIVCGALP